MFPNEGERPIPPEDQYAVRRVGFQQEPLVMVETSVETLEAMKSDKGNAWESTRGFTSLSRKVGMGTTVRAQWWLRTRCELADGFQCQVRIDRAYLLLTSVGNLAPTGISRAFGGVRIVREDVREGSFGDRWEWSLLMVTANGHWLDT